MALRCQVMFIIVMVALCGMSLSQQRRVPTFSTSLSFTRRIRLRVQNLLLQYKRQQLGDEQFDDRDLVLHSLPSVTIDYSQWLEMKDWDRLRKAGQDLKTFWIHLDIKRRDLETERQKAGAQMSGEKGRQGPFLDQNMLHVQVDLRDLIRQVRAQLHWLNSTSVSEPNPVLHPALNHAPWVTSSPTPPLLPIEQLWSSRLQGYIILRDLSLYLGKLAREFTLLGTKYHG